MELIEREEFLSSLHTFFENTLQGEGHSVFVCGESGIGKTSLVKEFCREVRKKGIVLTGTCDALFAPRPLAPLYDILLQLNNEGVGVFRGAIADRGTLFSEVFHALKNQPKPPIVVFEDIHWADEATLDFIKFLARRITQIPCLLLLTYRDNEIDLKHPLRHVFGQLIPGSFSRLSLPPLSRDAVEKMANAKGYKGEDIYKISAGIPFYVQEMLASYNDGVPENIRDSILSAYSRCDEKAKLVWNLLSVEPSGFELTYMEKVEPGYAHLVGSCIDQKIMVVDNNRLFFKHELFRRTIESSLSPLQRISLHKMILDLFKDSFEAGDELERIIHHAKNANEKEWVVRYAPMAARKAAALGAHIEAAKLYLTAIEYYQEKEKDVLVQFYEAYAYECYLTSQIKEAIKYTGKSLDIWKDKRITEQTGNSLRFLSRLWWFDGNRKQSEYYAKEAIAVLEQEPSSKVKAMAFSNMSQLQMLADKSAGCVKWGEKAIAIANEINDEEILSHATNNVGAVLLMKAATQEKGIHLLEQSLALAIKNGYHEHAARAYTNLGSGTVKIMNYAFAEKILSEGIQYCEERDLNSWTTYMLSWKARLFQETGRWKEAATIADNLINMQTYPPVRISALVAMALIRMRRAETGAIPLLLEAKTLAFDSHEVQRLIPVLSALLEYEWLTGDNHIEQKEIDTLIELLKESENTQDNSHFIFWLEKTRGQKIPGIELFEGHIINTRPAAKNAALLWKKLGCPYEQALALFEGNDDDKRKAVSILHELGAMAAYEKLKQLMRNSGIKSIPQGKRKSTQANPAHLTPREIDIVMLLKDGLQNKEIAGKLFISPKTVDHHISSLLFKLDVNSRNKAVQEAIRLGILK